jgi:hypothetical protein
MAISVAPGVRILDERRFFTGMALAMAVAAFVGFAPTYYLAAWNDAPKPVITPSVHIHGALCTAWILLLAVQARLIAARRLDIHRLTGIAGSVLAVATLVMGIFVAMGSERRVHTAANAGTLGDPYVFLIFPLSAVGLFALFAIIGIAIRKRPAAHKRMMLLATMSLLGPALARAATQAMKTFDGSGTAFAFTLVPGAGAVAALVLIDLFLAALVVYDLLTRGRLHPATLWAGGFLLLSEPLRVAIGYSQPWQDFARMLMS